jgi:hypothetical protein
MDTGFQHFTHGDGHEAFLKVGSKIQPENCCCRERQRQHLVGLDSRLVSLERTAQHARPPSKTEKL